MASKIAVNVTIAWRIGGNQRLAVEALAEISATVTAVGSVELFRGVRVLAEPAPGSAVGMRTALRLSSFPIRLRVARGHAGVAE